MIFMKKYHNLTLNMAAILNSKRDGEHKYTLSFNSSLFLDHDNMVSDTKIDFLSRLAVTILAKLIVFDNGGSHLVFLPLEKIPQGLPISYVILFSLRDFCLVQLPFDRWRRFPVKRGFKLSRSSLINKLSSRPYDK